MPRGRERHDRRGGGVQASSDLDGLGRHQTEPGGSERRKAGHDRCRTRRGIAFSAE